ncbi:MAG: hypothetical protein DRP85_00765 [Candidatus Makaraimicrobium thalassicum]|nr:MAG: hypothetical protein DRP85_00765 [Candidatus Omnitrophota bacterium]
MYIRGSYDFERRPQYDEHGLATLSDVVNIAPFSVSGVREITLPEGDWEISLFDNEIIAISGWRYVYLVNIDSGETEYLGDAEEYGIKSIGLPGAGAAASVEAGNKFNVACRFRGDLYVLFYGSGWGIPNGNGGVAKYVSGSGWTKACELDIYSKPEMLIATDAMIGAICHDGGRSDAYSHDGINWSFTNAGGGIRPSRPIDPGDNKLYFGRNNVIRVLFQDIFQYGDTLVTTAPSGFVNATDLTSYWAENWLHNGDFYYWNKLRDPDSGIEHSVITVVKYNGHVESKKTNLSSFVVHKIGRSIYYKNYKFNAYTHQFEDVGYIYPFSEWLDGYARSNGKYVARVFNGNVIKIWSLDNFLVKAYIEDESLSKNAFYFSTINDNSRAPGFDAGTLVAEIDYAGQISCLTEHANELFAGADQSGVVYRLDLSGKTLPTKRGVGDPVFDVIRSPSAASGSVTSLASVNNSLYACIRSSDGTKAYICRYDLDWTDISELPLGGDYFVRMLDWNGYWCGLDNNGTLWIINENSPSGQLTVEKVADNFATSDVGFKICVDGSYLYGLRGSMLVSRWDGSRVETITINDTWVWPLTVYNDTLYYQHSDYIWCYDLNTGHKTQLYYAWGTYPLQNMLIENERAFVMMHKINTSTCGFYTFNVNTMSDFYTYNTTPPADTASDYRNTMILNNKNIYLCYRHNDGYSRIYAWSLDDLFLSRSDLAYQIGNEARRRAIVNASKISQLRTYVGLTASGEVSRHYTPTYLSHNYLNDGIGLASGLSILDSAVYSVAQNAANVVEATLNSWQPSGSLYYTDVTHNLGHKYVMVQLYNSETDKSVSFDSLEAIDENTLRVFVSSSGFYKGVFIR